MKETLFILVVSIVFVGYSQTQTTEDKTELDKNYREDQFYAGVTYNLLNNKPNDVSQSGFSSGFQFGFIRDMPINERRNFAIGLGLGLSANSYNQNILISQTSNTISYEIYDGNEFNVTKNKFTTYLVEVPLEIRWRTSTPTDYNFWRIYGGIKLGYLFYNSSKFRSDQGNRDVSNNPDFENIQYGLTLSLGYATWNFYAYYGLNPIFNQSATLDGETIDLSTIKLGLMFYIL